MISPEKKRDLRKKTHALKPIILLGQHGLTPNVLLEIERALDYHELIKIRVNAQAPAERAAIIDTICQRCNASLIQSIGHIIAIYREKRES